MLAKFTHSSLRTDDVLSVQITSDGVANGLAKESGNYVYLKDHLGTVKEIAKDGVVVQKLHYSAFGQLLAFIDASDNPFTNGPQLNTSYSFTGREFDAETGNYYYRARYYDPSLGRFLQMDPHPGHLSMPVTIFNKFQYGANSPSMNSDSSGRDFWSDLGKAVVLVGVAALCFYTGGLAGVWLVSQIGAASVITSSIGLAIFNGVVGAVAGAFVGGVVGALLFESLDLGSAKEGFQFGAFFGAIGGAAYGSGEIKSDVKFTERPLEFSNTKKYADVPAAVRSTANSVELIYRIGTIVVPAGVATNSLLACSSQSLENCDAKYDIKVKGSF